jgi:hypothetical protein
MVIPFYARKINFSSTIRYVVASSLRDRHEVDYRQRAEKTHVLIELSSSTRQQQHTHSELCLFQKANFFMSRYTLESILNPCKLLTSPFRRMSRPPKDTYADLNRRQEITRPRSSPRTTRFSQWVVPDQCIYSLWKITCKNTVWLEPLTVPSAFGLPRREPVYLQCRRRLAACFIAFDAVDLPVHHVFELIGAARARIMLTEFARVRLAIFAQGRADFQPKFVT